jgi:HD-like signal output (HDOD) protein
LTQETPKAEGNPLIVIGDQIAPKAYLAAFMQSLRAENELLDAEEAIKYAVCADSSDVAQALRRHLDSVKMILIGPGLLGNAITVARMLSKKAHIVMVIDNAINPLGSDPATIMKTQKNLEELGVIIVMVKKATDEFFQPVVKDYVLSGLTAGADLASMSPEERADLIDKRLDAVSKFPSLPDTQRKVSALDDLDSPKKWAAAIDEDIPTRTVILRILNSARYSFRSRVETIEQAVTLASSKTIREIVTACSIRQIFQKTAEGTIDQFWRHSLATGFYAKLLVLPADPAEQSSQQKTEFERYQLDEEQVQTLQDIKLWQNINLEEKDDPFISGLMHDVGKVTMLMCMEDSLELVTALIGTELEEAQAEGKLWAHSVIEIERFLMKDIDHQVIGGRLANKWELDSSIELVITHHHDIQEHSPDLLKLIALANLAASTLFPYPATAEQHPFPQLFARIEKAVKSKAGMSLDEAVNEAINQDTFEDLVDVLNRLDISNHLWEIVDFKTFFRLCYIIAPKIKSASIAFLQQTG